MTSGIEVPPNGTIGQGELEAITVGACVHASGAGGSLIEAHALAAELSNRLGDRSVQLVSLDALGDDVAVAAPTTHPRVRARPSIDTATRAFQLLGERTVGRFDAVMPLSLSPADVMVALGVALECGVPVVDASGAVRPATRMTMTSWAANGVAPGLLAFADGVDTTTIGTDSVIAADDAARALIDGGSMAGSIGAAAWAMSGPAARRSSISGALSAAWRLGEEIVSAQRNSRDAVARALAFADGAIVIGRGPLRRSVVALDGDDDRLEIQIDTPLGLVDVIALDANLRVVRRDATVVAAPDVITVLDPSGNPRTLRELTRPDAEGLMLTVMAMPAPSVFDSPIVLDAFGDLRRRAGGTGERVPFPQSSA